jgi:hypothetical protein
MERSFHDPCAFYAIRAGPYKPEYELLQPFHLRMKIDFLAKITTAGGLNLPGSSLEILIFGRTDLMVTINADAGKIAPLITLPRFRNPAPAPGDR